MASAREAVREMIMRQIRGGSCDPNAGDGPAVLSCGGIYIPHKNATGGTRYQIINTNSENEPVKIVTGERPMNELHSVLIKESMN